MDNELDLLLGTLIDSLAKVMILFHLQDGAAAVLSPEAVAQAIGRRPEPVARALTELAEGGLVQRFAVGTGRIVRYSASEDRHVQSLLKLLRTRWEESTEGRAEVMRKVLRTPPVEDEPPTRRV